MNTETATETPNQRSHQRMAVPRPGSMCPEWFKKRMEAVKSQPPIGIEEMRQQFAAGIRQRHNEKVQERRP
jgi:hypothetical protein